jgi:hypothetical protein
MSDSLPNAADVKLLPEPAGEAPAGADPARADGAVVSGISPQRQLSELPRDELQHLAEDFGLDPTRHADLHDLVTAIHDRRQMISGLNREAMLDVVRWGRRPVTANAANEQIAQEIARIRSMNFAGLSQRGLVALARMRGIPAQETDLVPALVKQLKKQEGFFKRFARKRRAFVGSLVAKMVGYSDSDADYQFLPDPAGGPGEAPSRTSSLKEDIEEAGLIGGLTSRLKKTADAYLNQKLDEIEARIDRKLDEIDRRLGDWRDKEIANRIKILKITLWASVIVGAASLIYSYITVIVMPRPSPPVNNVPAHVQEKPGNK